MVAKQTQCTVEVTAGGFWDFFVCAEVCVLILINQQDLIEARMAHSLSKSTRDRVFTAQRTRVAEGGCRF